MWGQPPRQENLEVATGQPEDQLEGWNVCRPVAQRGDRKGPWEWARDD